MTDIMHEADFPHEIPQGHHVRTYGKYLPRPAYDATPDMRCTSFGKPTCTGLCPRHRPAQWSEHMARHVAGESL